MGWAPAAQGSGGWVLWRGCSCAASTLSTGLGAALGMGVSVTVCHHNRTLDHPLRRRLDNLPVAVEIAVQNVFTECRHFSTPKNRRRNQKAQAAAVPLLAAPWDTPPHKPIPSFPAGLLARGSLSVRLPGDRVPVAMAGKSAVYSCGGSPGFSPTRLLRSSLESPK